jgi:hypothetical protein
MPTTSNFSSNEESTRACSARVEYKDRQGPCQRSGKYPDHDGIRWWCGLHNPDRQVKVKPADEQDVETSAIDREVLVGIRPEQDDEMMEALEEARVALAEIANISVENWAPNTPVEKYKIIMAHMADRAREAGSLLAKKILRFKS